MTDARTARYDFTLNPAPSVRVEHVGEEREPVLIIDGVLRHPEALVDYAATEVAFAPAWREDDGFPGLRAPAPLNFIRSVVLAVSDLVVSTFDLGAVKLGRAECNLSIVSMRPDDLAPKQRIPHVDTSDPLQFAYLLYLGAPRFGGTAFYRHRSTGFEAITPERWDEWQAVRTRELAEAPPAGYIAGDTAHYAQTGAVDAVYNRLVIYRSRLLHAGLIPPGIALPTSPREGRLTANIFVAYRPLS